VLNQERLPLGDLGREVFEKFGGKVRPGESVLTLGALLRPQNAKLGACLRDCRGRRDFRRERGWTRQPTDRDK
jgi:hypothetical protein